jgi:hypothetical protein
MSGIPFADFKAREPFSFIKDEDNVEKPTTNLFTSDVDAPRFLALMAGRKKAVFKVTGTFVEDSVYENKFAFYFKPDEPEAMMNLSNLLEPNTINKSVRAASTYNDSFLHRALVNEAGNMKLKLKPTSLIFGKKFNNKALGYEFGAKLVLTVTAGFYFVEGYYGIYFDLLEIDGDKPVKGKKI